MLRTLRWSLVDLPLNLPYHEARLHRIADQVAYIVQTWPDEQWPTWSSEGHAVPAAAVLLNQLAALPSDCRARQRELLAIVLLLH